MPRAPVRYAVVRLAVVAAAFAAIAALAAFESDPAAAAEGAFLAKLVAGTLLAVAVLAPPPAHELGLGAMLAAAAVWSLPAGPGRAAITVATLTATLALALTRRIRAWHSRPLPPWAAQTAVTTALCFGCQILMRGELLFSALRTPRTWAAFLVLPLAAGATLALLWRRHGALRALAAAGAAAVMAPGWTVATTLALAALAGGTVLGRHSASTGSLDPASSNDSAEPAASTASAASTGSAASTASATSTASAESSAAAEPTGATGTANPRPSGSRARSAIPARLAQRLRRAAGVIALLLPAAWSWRSGWGATLAGMALWNPAAALGIALPLGLAARFAPLSGALAPHASWREGLTSAKWLIAIVPATTIVLGYWLLSRTRRPATAPVERGLALGSTAGTHPSAGAEKPAAPSLATATAPAARGAAGPQAGHPSVALAALAALVIAFATPWLPDRSVLAAPIALAALALPSEGAAAGLAATWSLALTAATALLAAYPWMRSDALADAAGLFGARFAISATSPGRLAAAATLAALAIVWIVSIAPRAVSRVSPNPAASFRCAAWTTGACIFGALLLPLVLRPPIGLLAPGSTLLLDRTSPSWHAELSAPRVRAVALETSMVNAAALTPGTPVARIRLLRTSAPPVELLLLAGRDSGDWAARRPDVLAAAPHTAPPPWLVWVAGGYFGQRYRARLPLPQPASFARLEIELAANLPPATGLAIHQVEIEP